MAIGNLLKIHGWDWLVGSYANRPIFALFFFTFACGSLLHGHAHRHAHGHVFLQVPLTHFHFHTHTHTHGHRHGHLKISLGIAVHRGRALLSVGQGTVAHVSADRLGIHFGRKVQVLGFNLRRRLPSSIRGGSQPSKVGGVGSGSKSAEEEGKDTHGELGWDWKCKMEEKKMGDE